MNKILLVGRLTGDPEMRVFGDDRRAMAKFTLAVGRRFKNQEGDREADFIPVTLWGRQAEVAGEHLTKGRLISISGRLQTRSYEDKEGKKRYVTEVVADAFEFLDSKKVI